jgi:hypothetical protein
MFSKGIIKKPYMFRSLLYDHHQGLSFLLISFTSFPLLASSFAFSVCGRMPLRVACYLKFTLSPALTRSAVSLD